MTRFHEFVADTPVRTLGKHGLPVGTNNPGRARREAEREQDASAAEGFKPRNRARRAA